jgi:RHS repeat-associated protein
VLTDDNGAGNVYTPGLARRQGSTDLFLEGGRQGSTRTLENSTGTLFPNGLWYDAYGNRTFTGGTPYDPIDFQFGGQWGYQTEYADASTNEPGVGLDYLQQRYYDPVVGRFISPDPIGFAGGLNLYGYAGNDPVNEADPLGLMTLPNDPSGLGPGWYRDPGHLGSERWIRDDGKLGLDFDKARPGAGREQENDHWHVLTPSQRRPGRWDRGNAHLRPGSKIADCGAADAGLQALLDQTILDEVDIRPLSPPDGYGNPYPARPLPLSPDGIEPDETFDLFLVGLLTEVLAPEITFGPETVGPPPVELPVPDPRQFPVPAF